MGLLRRVPTGIAAALLASAAAAFYGAALERESYNSDEGAWMTEGVDALRVLREGRFDDPFWSRGHLLYGYASPTVSKVLVGIGMSAAGHGRREELGRPERLETLEPWRPPEDVLRAGRLSSVVLGSVAVGVLFVLLAAGGSRRTAAWAAVLLAASPLWIRASRHAMTDIHGVAAAILVLPLFVAAAEATRRRGAGRAAGRWALAGVAAGLAVGCKFSAAGFVAGLGVLALLGTRRTTPGGGDARRSIREGAAASLVFGVAAVVAFVAAYPYLWPDPVGRFRGILELWRDVQTLRAEHRLAAFAASFFHPGPESVRAAARLLLVPDNVGGWALLAPLGAAVLARWKRIPPSRATLVVWVSATPALIAGVVARSTVAHSWVVWAGAVGAIATAAATGGAFRVLASRPAACALAAGTAGSLAFILPTTYVAWARYYLPLFPAMAVAAAWSFGRLRDAMQDLGGRPAARLLDVALGAGALATLAAFPESGTARMGALAGMPGGAAPSLQRLAVALLCAALAWSLARVARPAAPEPSPPPR